MHHCSRENLKLRWQPSEMSRCLRATELHISWLNCAALNCWSESEQLWLNGQRDVFCPEQCGLEFHGESLRAFDQKCSSASEEVLS